jgi:hypothetical protein
MTVAPVLRRTFIQSLFLFFAVALVYNLVIVRQSLGLASEIRSRSNPPAVSDLPGNGEVLDLS